MTNKILKKIILLFSACMFCVFTYKYDAFSYIDSYNILEQNSMDSELIINSEEKEKVKKVIYYFNKSLSEEFVDELSTYICELSGKYNIKKNIILAIFAHESKFEPFAKNRYSSATGLGQIIPRYWVSYLGVSSQLLKNNWKINAEGSVKILKYLYSNWGHLSDWPGFYYSVNIYDRKKYYSQLKFKIKKIDEILGSESENG